ncbi:hypothetical protein HHJ78_10930 [Mobiluncus mulieris]|uniref:Uncharacterized protein n=1 Tax=Mobiluncus mulieris TaxID=2052 RepID=A0A7Y0U3X8_9ACTO|nr:hypothetical protein [Mobiluncus mulieris]NMW65998.1 hypothetical protein [Mobiluncus mulieris]
MPSTPITTILHALEHLHAEILAYHQPNSRHRQENTTHTRSTISTQEALLIAHEEIAKDWQTILNTAHDLSWRGYDPDGTPGAYIATRLDWAQNNYPGIDDALQNIRHVYHKWVHATKRTAPRNGETCPSCRQPMTTPTPGHLYCPKHGDMTRQEYDTAIHAKLLEHGQFLTIQQTRQHYGLTWRQLETAISDGRLQIMRLPGSKKRRIHTAQIETLFHFNPQDTPPKI